jgi:large subunit ribosomal protein L9
MKVLLIKDVYKLGRAGDVKKVADGYGRNFLVPQGLAVLATPGAMKNVENIRSRANTHRDQMNNELGGVASKLTNLVVAFPSKAGETGKLYGSITSQMIAEAITRKSGVEIDRRQIDCQPIRTLGEHKASIRLTVDLTPEIRIIVHREGETPNLPGEAIEETAAETAPAPEAEVEVETSAEEAA